MSKISEAEAFLIALNRERTAYRVPAPVQVVEKTVIASCRRKHYDRCSRHHSSDVRDQMLFNAGRFAAGATDRVAADAHTALMDTLGK
jgi:hypothetical protein